MPHPARFLAPIAAIALAFPALAGCLGPAAKDAPATPQDTSLPPGKYAEILKEHTPLTASDGVVLDMWTFRPKVEGEKFPVILEDSPYFGNLDPPASTGGQPFSQWLIRTFVPQGYAVVLKSVRGTGSSGGCFGMGDEREVVDGVESVEWLAKLPWSSGEVAMIGKSYRGTTPIQTAIKAPAHLKTIVPISGISEWFLYTYSPGGVPYKDWVGFNTEYQATVGFMSDMPQDDPANLPQYVQKVCPGDALLSGSEAQSLATGEENDQWQARNYAKDTSKIKASVYLVHGLIDFNVKPDQVAVDWFNKVPTFKHALLGQWPHEYPNRVDWGSDLYRWFEHELKGVDNGIEREPVVKVQDSSGEWRFESQWPPARATAREWTLASGGKLTDVPGEKSGASFTASPGTRADGQNASAAGQLVFRSGPLAERVHVAGVPRLAFNASIDRATTIFAVTLYDVSGSSWQKIDWAFLDARHRNSITASDPVVPLTVEAYRLQFFPMDHVFPAGHEVAIAIAGADPDWVLNPPSGATANLALGKGSALRMPTVAGELLESPQPDVKKFTDLDWYKPTA